MPYAFQPFVVHNLMKGLKIIAKQRVTTTLIFSMHSGSYNDRLINFGGNSFNHKNNTEEKMFETVLTVRSLKTKVHPLP